MKICTHRGLDIVVLTRNEHCPPHVHVGAHNWDARFQFAFWHNGVRLWDVVPAREMPSVATLEEIRLAIKQPANLRYAREIWWRFMQRVCLENQRWDAAAGEVVSNKKRRTEARVIEAARFDATSYKTWLWLAEQPDPVEIEL